MKRQRMNEKGESYAKKHKPELETNSFLPGEHLEEEILETDGENIIDICTNRTSGKFKPYICNSDSTRLKAGFGFNKKTLKCRISPRELSNAIAVQRVQKAASNANVVIDQGIEASSFSIKREITETVSCDKQLVANTKTLEHNADNTSSTQHKTDDQCVSYIEGKAETPETDTIYTRELQEWKLPNAPFKVPGDYVEISPKKLPTEQRTNCFITLNKKKDQQTKILIPHKDADKPEGDDFGADLCTYIQEWKYEKRYYRHFFEEVEPLQPASEMRIKNNDELVLVNGVFVPALKHTQVLNLFHQVKVDGQTRLSLVIRRKMTKQKWDWIETSAVLAAEKHTDIPAVTGKIYKEMDGDKPFDGPMSKHFYKVPGTQKYIDIRDGKVTIGTMNKSDNRTKIIWKHPKFWQVGDEGHIDFATTLCDQTKKWYIAVDQSDQIVVKREEVWFKMIKRGSKIRFQLQKLYLGYDIESNKLRAQVTDCLFEELPVPSVDIVDDVSARKKNEIVPKDEQNNAEKLSLTQGLRININLAQAGTHPIRGSDRSTLSSLDSGTDIFEFSSSCSSGTDTSERLPRISSQSPHSSETSGYMSATPDDIDIKTPKEVPPKVPPHGFPWCPQLVHVNTPTTPMNNLDLSGSGVD